MIAILIPSFFLFLFGFFNLFGIRPAFGYTMLMNFGMGLLLFFVFKKIGWKFFRSNIMLIYWFFILILLITYFIGVEVKGSKRWIDLIFFRFQASEFFKIFFILFLADFFAKLPRRSNDFLSLALSLFYFAVPAFIIFKQPDLGNASVYTYIFFTMLLFSSISKKQVMTLIGLIALVLPFSWFFMKEYQKNRIISFFEVHQNQQENAYNMVQAIITVGSGKLFGRGLGLGTQSRLFFLPENSTDFAFSSLVEQFGFVGGFLTLFLYASILFLLCKRAHKFVLKDDESGRFTLLFLLGLISLIFFQVLVNVGMNLGLLPIAGISLPFISYGGSMLVALMIGFALVP